MAQGAVPVFDIVGVGFGPSTLALAIAVTEYNRTSEQPVTAQFLKRTSSLLSNTAVRVGEILQSIVDRRTRIVPVQSQYAAQGAS
jgi:hypothetical protein